MRKTFVLDTSVLLFDPNSIFKFKEHKVYVPLVVIEELDKFKRDQNENGRNARQFSRIVDDLRKKGPLSEGIALENNGTFVIGHEDQIQPNKLNFLNPNQNDNIILSAAISLKQKGEKTTLVSKDINLRLKSDALGINSEDYGKSRMTIDELYSGYRVYEVEPDVLSKFEAERFLEVDNELEATQFHANEYIILMRINVPNHRLLGRYCATKKGIVPLIRVREGVWGIYPKNIEQQFAFDALLNDEIKLVTLLGKAGTGKTLLAIAAGLEQTITMQNYHRVLVSRPIVPMGRDLGFLPGDVNEKLGPWMQPIFDNIDFLFGTQPGKAGQKAASYEELINQGLLYIEPLTYIRGRSIPGQFLIVDEAQNLSPHEIKTIITRAGEGTKIVLTGDCEQIDNPYLDSVNNGLSYCVERLKNESIMAHSTLRVGERSELSEIASKLL